MPLITMASTLNSFITLNFIAMLAVTLLNCVPGCPFSIRAMWPISSRGDFANHGKDPYSKTLSKVDNCYECQNIVIARF